MKIHKIDIKNFKGFAERSFELNDQFTVFIGNNGTGKTTVLDALASSLNNLIIGFGVNAAKSMPLREFTRVITIDGQPKKQYPFSVIAGVKLNGLDSRIGFEETEKGGRGKSPAFKIASEMLAESRTRSGVTFPVIAYYGTNRLWEDASKKVDYLKQEEGVRMAYESSLEAKINYKFLSWFKTQEDTILKFQQPQDIKHLNAFKQAILSLIPDNRLSDIAFDRKTDELTGIYTDDERKKNMLKYSQLSDGFRTITGLAADIAYRCIQLNPHLGENAVAETAGVVLIDELDLHLHPNWQRHIVADLKRVFPKIQFVATTHSPFIVQSLSKDELINLDETEDHDGLEKSPTNYGIEDVAEIEMGVGGVARSIAFKLQVDAATKYFQLIKEGKTSQTDQEVAQLRTQLNEMEERFSDDQVFVAALRLERQLGNL